MDRASFATGYPFPLDPFQVRALDALDAGRSVLVAAPTGSGKTVVAEYAVAKALAEGGKAFYTTPIKALSNQKFGDLGRRYGPERVGLLTGDNSIGGELPVVVMTTEVLRNMIYAQSPTLTGLRFVVLDEVHFLGDEYRGPVWEEVIIHSPPDVMLVCLSATVSNAEEVADWIATVRGPTDAVIEERRPVELRQLHMVGDRESEHVHLLPTIVDGLPNPEAARLDSRSVRAVRGERWRSRMRSPLHTPRRVEVVERLDAAEMLPAIYFIFSRQACDDAVRQCLDAGMRLTSPAERERIRAVVDQGVGRMTEADLAALGHARWLAGLEAGIAAHHAGMVPPFKEAVERAFAAGLAKVVFATETLAVGVNMPARSVVIEKLSKFSGERHEFLTPGEYTQLTGRAGRRGIDEVGYAVTLWSAFVPFDQVAALASTRTYALTSSFRPTYNMAVNLVRRYRPDAAHHLLNLSFAQYRADRDVVRLEAQLEKTTRQLASLEAAASCELGDVAEYRGLVAAAREQARATRNAPDEVAEALSRLRPGDVVALTGGKSAGPAAVISVSTRRGGEVRIGALTPDRRYLGLSGRDFTAPPARLGRIDLPAPYAPRSQSFQRAVVERLRRVKLRAGPYAPGGGPPRGYDHGRDRSRDPAGEDPPGPAAAHPVHGCPGLATHLRALARVERLQSDKVRQERLIRGRTESLARQFDRVLRVLEAWGYVDHAEWRLTESGERLTRIYHECDLLVAEVLRSGALDGLDPPAVAGLVSTFTFQARRPNPGAPAPWFPSARVSRRWSDIERLATELNQMEDEAGLPLTRRPDAGFMAAAYAWALGDDLGDVIGEEELSGGDFVRNIKILIDLLRQVGVVAPVAETAATAARAADLLFRGVVASSSVLGE